MGAVFKKAKLRGDFRHCGTGDCTHTAGALKLPCVTECGGGGLALRGPGGTHDGKEQGLERKRNRAGYHTIGMAADRAGGNVDRDDVGTRSLVARMAGEDRP